MGFNSGFKGLTSTSVHRSIQCRMTDDYMIMRVETRGRTHGRNARPPQHFAQLYVVIIGHTIYKLPPYFSAPHTAFPLYFAPLSTPTQQEQKALAGHKVLQVRPLAGRKLLGVMYE